MWGTRSATSREREWRYGCWRATSRRRPSILGIVASCWTRVWWRWWSMRRVNRRWGRVWFSWWANWRVRRWSRTRVCSTLWSFQERVWCMCNQRRWKRCWSRSRTNARWFWLAEWVPNRRRRSSTWSRSSKRRQSLWPSEMGPTMSTWSPRPMWG